MYICQRKWCDLVFYHPDLPMLTIRAEPIIGVVETLDNQISMVIKERDKILELLEKS